MPQLRPPPSSSSWRCWLRTSSPGRRSTARGGGEERALRKKRERAARWAGYDRAKGVRREVRRWGSCSSSRRRKIRNNAASFLSFVSFPANPMFSPYGYQHYDYSSGRDYTEDYRMSNLNTNDRYVYHQRQEAYAPPRSSSLSKAARVFTPQKGDTMKEHESSSPDQQHMEQKSCPGPSSDDPDSFFDTPFLTPGGQAICFNYTAKNIPSLLLASTTA